MMLLLWFLLTPYLMGASVVFGILTVGSALTNDSWYKNIVPALVWPYVLLRC